MHMPVTPLILILVGFSIAAAIIILTNRFGVPGQGNS